MSILAMKQALESLDIIRASCSAGRMVHADNEAAIAERILRQAIEQAEKQEPVAWMMINPSHLPGNRSLHWEPQQWHITWKAVPLYSAPVHASDTNQERVDETVKDRHEPESNNVEIAAEQSDNYAAFLAGVRFERVNLPAPSKEWVGLTKTEFEEAVYGLDDLRDCWHAIETKLKEKNT